MLNRWVETEGLLDTLTDVGAGCIAFSPLAQGMLTDKYLDGVPEGSRASQDKSLSTDLLTDEAIGHIRTLNAMASDRGQTLAQMALAWALRNPEVSSVLVGASSAEQIRNNVAALGNLSFTEDELRVDRPARSRQRHRPVGLRPRGGRPRLSRSPTSGDSHRPPLPGG